MQLGAASTYAGRQTDTLKRIKEPMQIAVSLPLAPFAKPELV